MYSELVIGPVVLHAVTGSVHIDECVSGKHRIIVVSPRIPHAFSPHQPMLPLVTATLDLGLTMKAYEGTRIIPPHEFVERLEKGKL